MNREERIQCIKCKKRFDHLGHMRFNKAVCNRCCETSVFSEDGLFKGCSCVEEKWN